LTSTYEPEYQQLLIDLKNARRARHVTQHALGIAMNKTQAFVYKYETGERRLDVIEMVHIARLLDLEPCDLIKNILLEIKPLQPDRKYGFRE